MTNLEAAATLVEMYGQLTKLENNRGCVIAPEYSEAVSLAIMALRGERYD